MMKEEILNAAKSEKVTDKWFKEHNWKKYEYNTIESDNILKQVTIYELNNVKLHARWDRIVYTYPPKFNGDKKHLSRFYMFYAKGCTGFKVENRISHQNFKVDIIKSALNTVGYDEFGDWLDK